MRRIGAWSVAAGVLGIGAPAAIAQDGDCDGNNVPDAFEVASTRRSPFQSIGGEREVFAFAFGEHPRPDTDIDLRIEFFGWRFTGPDRYVDVFFNGELLARLFDDDGANCPHVEFEVVTIPWAWRADTGDVLVELRVTGGVGCGGTPQTTCTLVYELFSPLDVNQNGVLDACDVSPADLDASGHVNGDDLRLFVERFLGGDPRGDLVDDDVLNLDDLWVFAEAYVIATS